MIRLPPGSTRTDTLFPYTTLFRSDLPGPLTGVRDGDCGDRFFLPRRVVRRHYDSMGTDVTSLERRAATSAPAAPTGYRRLLADRGFAALIDRKSTRLNTSH